MSVLSGFGAVVGYVGAATVGDAGGAFHAALSAAFFARASISRCLAAACCMASAALWSAATSVSNKIANGKFQRTFIVALRSSSRDRDSLRRSRFQSLSDALMFLVTSMQGMSSAAAAFSFVAETCCDLACARRLVLRCDRGEDVSPFHRLPLDVTCYLMMGMIRKINVGGICGATAAGSATLARPRSVRSVDVNGRCGSSAIGLALLARVRVKVGSRVQRSRSFPELLRGCRRTDSGL